MIGQSMQQTQIIQKNLFKNNKFDSKNIVYVFKLLLLSMNQTQIIH